MTINIRATGMELSPAIRQYVEDKMNTLEKYAGDIILIDAVVGMETTHHQKGSIYTCAINVELKGDLLRVERNAEDLYKAIDKVRDHLRETLAQRKEKMIDERREG
ncbi:MAG: ribosome-associated translation inhibitor RaiA [Patescibacteria group bacterium]|jgi:ribosomal subunit interface protein